MDDLKRRVLALMDADRVRPRSHFLREAAKDDVSVDDALFAVRNGSHSAQADSDSKLGVRYVFRGTDTRSRKLDVVVSIDESSDTLWIHTVFHASLRKLKR